MEDKNASTPQRTDRRALRTMDDIEMRIRELTAQIVDTPAEERDEAAITEIEVLAAAAFLDPIASTPRGEMPLSHALVEFSNAPTAAGRLLVFGDSFLLTQLAPLTGVFAEILVCRSPYLHPEIAWSHRPDYILCETAERYLASPVEDRNAPPYLMTYGDIQSPADYGPGAHEAIGKALTGRSCEVRESLGWPA